MHKGNTLYIILVVLLLIGAGAFTIIYKNQSTPQPAKTANVPPTNLAEVALDSINNGSYVNYTPEVLEAAAGQRIVIYFYANWCPTCRPVDQEIANRMSEIPRDTQIIRVNYNDTDTDKNEESLADKYGITYQHTFVVIDQNGNEVQRWNGGGLDEILSRI